MTFSLAQTPARCWYSHIFQRWTLFGPLLVMSACLYQILIFHQTYSILFTVTAGSGLLLLGFMGRQGFASACTLQAVTAFWLLFEGSYPLVVLLPLEMLLFVAFTITRMALYEDVPRRIQPHDMPTVEGLPDELELLQEQKRRLWQELFDARQEIITFCQREQESIAVKELLQTKEEELRRALDIQNTLQELHRSLEEKVKTSTEILQQEIGGLKEERLELLKSIERLEAEQSQKKCDIGHSVFEARYHQLREQFDQKSNILDQVRQELFHTCEKHEVLLRSSEERTHFLQQEHEDMFFKSLKEASREQEEMLLTFVLGNHPL